MKSFLLHIIIIKLESLKKRANAPHWITNEVVMALEEYMAMKRFNIPFASNIDDALYHRLVIFSAIDDEYNKATKSDV